MFKKLMLCLSVIAMLVVFVPSTASAAVNRHKVVDCGRIGGFGPDIKVCYRMSYEKHGATIFQYGYARPYHIRFKIQSIPWYKGGGMPFNATHVIFHVRVIDDLSPPLAETVTRRKFTMLAAYYRNTFSMETTPRVLGLNPRVCVRVQIRIWLDRDIHDSLKCKYLT